MMIYMKRLQSFSATCTKIETFSFYPSSSSTLLILKCWLSINESRPVCLHCYSISSQASVDVFSFVSHYLLFCLCNAFCIYMYNNALLLLYDLLCVHVCILLSTSCKVLFMTSESCLVIVMYLGYWNKTIRTLTTYLLQQCTHWKIRG